MVALSQPSPDPAVARTMEPADVETVLEAHLTYFPENLVGRLGRDLLEVYYTAFVDGPHATAFVAEIDGEFAGYLVGVLDTTEHRRWLLRAHACKLLLAVGRSAVAHPLIIARVVMRRVGHWLRSRPTGRVGPTFAPQTPVAVLSHVAIAQEVRGRGAGDLLLRQFMQSCRRHGSRAAFLATRAGRDGAGTFYAARGWRKYDTTKTVDGRLLDLYEVRVALTDPRTP